MAKEHVNVERIEIPKGFSPQVTEYLSLLVSKDCSLMVKNNNLRGRQYNKGSILDFENKISTTDIKNLISKGYLTKGYTLAGYDVLKPHLFVSEYIRSGGLKKPFVVESIHGEKTTIGYFRDTKTGERSELINKGKAFKTSFHPHIFKIEAFRKGHSYQDIFCMSVNGVPCLFILGLKDNVFYQVYPKDVYKAIKLNKVEPKKTKIEFEHEITENSIRIVSESTSTSYIVHTKKEYPTLDTIKENYKLAKKYLSENKVRTLGKKETEGMLSDSKYADVYSNFLKEYSRLFDDLLKLSKELVEEGIVSGGSNNNPIYRQAWEVQRAMASLVNQPAVHNLLSKNNSFEKIIGMYNDETIDRLIKITL